MSPRTVVSKRRGGRERDTPNRLGSACVRVVHRCPSLALAHVPTRTHSLALLGSLTTSVPSVTSALRAGAVCGAPGRAGGRTSL
jgi:hypothetical protein